METRKVLILEFKSKKGKNIRIPVTRFSENLQGATIKSVMQAMLTSGALKVLQGNSVEEASTISSAYYSVQTIENIVIYNGDLQEQLKI